MAGRNKKDNADYFSHDADASSDEKILYLESLFGHTGYAVYFKMLECMTRAEGFKLEWNEIKKSIYASKFGISVTEFDRFITECCRKEVGAFKIEDGEIFSPGLLKRLQPLIDKREYNRNKYQQQKQAVSDSSISVTEMTQRKGKERKGKKREELEEGSTQSELTSGTTVPEAVSLPATSNNGVPAKKIAELWNSKQVENGSTLPKLAKINPKTQRYRHLRARWNEHPDMQTWGLVVDKATKSDFLNGRVAKFQASFDWVVKSADNFTKTLEGNYDNKKDKAGSASGMTLEQFKEEFNMEIDSLSELEYWVGKGTIRADQKRRFQQ
jgi:hypothetical protein